MPLRSRRFDRTLAALAGVLGACLSAAPSAGAADFVFSSRIGLVSGSEEDVPAAGVADRAESGSLLLRTSDGELVTLVDARVDGAPDFAPIDVSDPDVSFDGTRIVFAGLSPQENAWRIYEVGVDGNRPAPDHSHRGATGAVALRPRGAGTRGLRRSRPMLPTGRPRLLRVDTLSDHRSGRTPTRYESLRRQRGWFGGTPHHERAVRCRHASDRPHHRARSSTRAGGGPLRESSPATLATSLPSLPVRPAMEVPVPAPLDRVDPTDRSNPT